MRTPLRRATIAVLESVSNRLWNLRVNLMADAVDQHGPIKTLRWFASNMPTYEKILKEWGPIKTHYLASAISIINGCGYCTYGHAYAFQLNYFDQTGRLFAISEQEMMAATELHPEEAVRVLEKALVESDMIDECMWLYDAIKMQETKVATNEDERRMLHLINMFAWLNDCGMNANTVPDNGAHSPINKDEGLKERYRRALGQ